MARTKRRGGGFGSFVRAFNPGNMISLAPPSGAGSLTAGIKPANITGVLPIIGGMVANAAIKGMLSKFIPKTGSGLGSHLLGLATAGVVGAVGNMVSKQVGASMLTGALVGVGSGVLTDVQTKGIGGAFALGDDFGDGLAAWDFSTPDVQQGFSMSGVGDFVTPQAIQAAFPAQPTQYQYALPSPSAVPATVANAGGAQALKGQDDVLAEIIDNGGGF